MKQLKSTSAVIKALGGIRTVANLTGRNYDAAEAWKRFPHFPPDTYLILNQALRRKKLGAPLSLWRMIEPKKA